MPEAVFGYGSYFVITEIRLIIFISITGNQGICEHIFSMHVDECFIIRVILHRTPWPSTFLSLELSKK